MVYVTNDVYQYYVLFYKTEVQIQCQKESTILNIVHKSR